MSEIKKIMGFMRKGRIESDLKTDLVILSLLEEPYCGRRDESKKQDE